MATEVKEKEKPKVEIDDLSNYRKNWGWITALTVYFVAFGILSMWAILAFFPCAITADNAASACPKTVGFMLWDFKVSDEMRMIVLVMMAGSLGSLVHGFRSLFWYVGNHAFSRSWILMYILLPFIGSSLSVIFYFVLRGGLFSATATVDAASPFGFIGLAGLVGMFSNRAALKLQEVADSFFSTKESTKGKDNVDKETLEAEKKSGGRKG